MLKDLVSIRIVINALYNSESNILFQFKTPVLVSKHIYKHLEEELGKKWCKKYIIMEDEKE